MATNENMYLGWGYVKIYNDTVKKDPITGSFSGVISAIYRWSNNNGCVIFGEEKLKNVAERDLSKQKEECTKKLMNIWKKCPKVGLWAKVGVYIAPVRKNVNYKISRR